PIVAVRWRVAAPPPASRSPEAIRHMAETSPLPAMKSAVRRRIGSSQYRFDGELPISRRELLRHLPGPRGLEQTARDLVQLGADVAVGRGLVADARGDPHEREGQLACVAALVVRRGAPVVDGRGTTRPRAEDGAHLLDRHVEHRTRLDRGLGEAAGGGPHEVVDLLGAQRARGEPGARAPQAAHPFGAEGAPVLTVQVPREQVPGTFGGYHEVRLDMPARLVAVPRGVGEPQTLVVAARKGELAEHLGSDERTL